MNQTRVGFSRVRVVGTLALALVGAGVFVGCTLVQNERLRGARYHETHLVAGDARAAHEACRAVLEGMGFEWERGTPATGELVMASRVQPGNAAQLARQRRAEVAVRGAGASSNVSIGFWEVSEESGPGTNIVPAARLLHGGALYEAFWQHMAAALPPPPLPTADPGVKGTTTGSAGGS